MNDNPRLVYVATFSDNYAYVGTTDDFKDRLRQHLFDDKKSEVYQHKRHTGLIPTIVPVTDYMDAHEADIQEMEYTLEYASKGYKMLNAQRPGGYKGLKKKKRDVCFNESIIEKVQQKSYRPHVGKSMFLEYAIVHSAINGMNLGKETTTWSTPIGGFIADKNESGLLEHAVEIVNKLNDGIVKVSIGKNYHDEDALSFTYNNNSKNHPIYTRSYSENELLIMNEMKDELLYPYSHDFEKFIYSKYHLAVLNIIRMSEEEIANGSEHFGFNYHDLLEDADYSMRRTFTDYAMHVIENILYEITHVRWIVWDSDPDLEIQTYENLVREDVKYGLAKDEDLHRLASTYYSSGIDISNENFDQIMENPLFKTAYNIIVNTSLQDASQLLEIHISYNVIRSTSIKDDSELDALCDEMIGYRYKNCVVFTRIELPENMLSKQAKNGRIEMNMTQEMAKWIIELANNNIKVQSV